MRNDNGREYFSDGRLKSEGKYKVMECNTVNSSNFYNCDFKKIVLAMDQLMKKYE